MVVLLLLLLFFIYGPFYSHFLHRYSKYLLIALFTIYVVFILPYFIFRKKQTYFRIYEIFLYLGSLAGIRSVKADKEKHPDYRHYALSFLMKMYFIPVMVNYSLWMLKLIKNNPFYTDFSFGHLGHDFHWFFSLAQIIFLLDLSIYTFAYIVESKRLNNKIKSVDKTLLGWISALVCYHPASLLMLIFFVSVDDSFYFINDTWTSVFYGLTLLLYLFDLSATLALGFKAGNLTNRGIVTKGPYRLVRHPSYLVKILVFWLLAIPVFNSIVLLSGIAWTIVYLLRVYTEERHLKQDVDFQSYKHKTKYKLIPGVY